MGTSTLGVKRILSTLSLFAGVLFPIALFMWKHTAFAPFATLLIISSCYLLALVLLWLRLRLTEPFWIKLWASAAPWLISSLFALPSVSIVPLLPLLPLLFVLLGLWGSYRFYPLHLDTRLHKARFARLDELSPLLSHIPSPDGLLMGTHKLVQHFVCVRPTTQRREIGNMLIVGPTRSGKGLLATSQLLSWHHSVIVNDIKGDLFTATAGYRATLGRVFVIDPQGYGHRYDPLLGKRTEDEFYSSAAHLLFTPNEGEGIIFTQRATVMLTQLFLAAKQEGIASLPYARSLIRAGLQATARRLNHINPQLATQFLDVRFAEANLEDKFLLSAWGTLTAKMRPILTETVVRTLTTSDVTAADLLCSERPVTVYIRWKEQDLLALSPLVRLLWGSLINELLTIYDINQGNGCHPVLLLIDEAGRTAIPILADQATTVVGRGIYMWVAVQSLSQLEAEYGKARSQILRDNMESQIYYRPTDLATAQYLEERIGTRSAYAHSHTLREGAETSLGLSERPIPLLTAQSILQLRDEEIIGFHRRLPPFKLNRIDWRKYSTLKQRKHLPAPHVSMLPQVPEIPIENVPGQTLSFTDGYIDPDLLHN
jgi:type IV secretion system protein VirD4